MNPLRRMQARGLAQKLMTAATPQAVGEIRDQLLALGGDAIRAIFEALPVGPVPAAATQVLDRLLAGNTLSEYLEGMRSQRPEVAEAAVAALSDGTRYDPSSLLDLLEDSEFPRPRLAVVLNAQVQHLQPRVMLAMLPTLPREARGTLVRLLEARADASVGPDLVSLSGHEDYALRLFALRILARLDNPASVEVATRLLEDPHSAVRLEAVRTLAALKAVDAIPSMCRRLREAPQTRTAHITMVLDEPDSDARRRALQAGADDYLTGPLDAARLIERVEGPRTKGAPPRINRLANGIITLDVAAHQVRVDAGLVAMRPNEFQLLAHFIQNRDQVFSRAALIEQLGKHDGAIDDRTVDVWVGRLRRALIAAGAPDPLRTVRSLGYVMDSVES